MTELPPLPVPAGSLVRWVAEPFDYGHSYGVAVTVISPGAKLGRSRAVRVAPGTLHSPDWDALVLQAYGRICEWASSYDWSRA